MIEMSRRPPLMKDSASLRLVSGVTNPGCCGVVLDQPVLEGAEAEEPVLLFHLDEVAAVDRTVALDAGLDRVVVLAAHAVEALVDVLVDVAVVVDRGEELLHALVVARFGRADEVVVLDVEGGPGLAELLGLDGRSTPAGTGRSWPRRRPPSGRVRPFRSGTSSRRRPAGASAPGRRRSPSCRRVPTCGASFA